MPPIIRPFELDANDTPAPSDPAAGMSTLRRGFESARLASDMNSLGAKEAWLRSDGRTAEADTLRGQINAISGRAAQIAPEVSDLRDVNLGNVGTYIAGQVGQGVGSMIDPAAASLAIGGAGKLIGLSKNPIAQAISRGAQYLAPAAAFGINQRQATGEFYNDAVQNPELMKNRTPQEINRMANLAGAASGALDTALPHIAAGQVLGNKTLRAFDKLSPVRKLAVEALGEGGTEAAQEAIKQHGLGTLDPTRNTSGDNWDLANSFAGGVLGSGGISGPAVAVESARNRVNGVAGQLGKKAGETFDTATGAATSVGEAGKSISDKLKGLFSRGSATEDLGAAPEQGKADERPAFALSPEELNSINNVPPAGVSLDGPDFNQWYRQNDQARGQTVIDHLASLGEHDPVAQQLHDRVADDSDPAAQMDAIDEGAKYLTGRHEEDALLHRAAQQSRGEEAAKALGGVAMKGAAAAGKTALRFGKALFNGASEAMSKKNEQSTDDTGHRAAMFGNYLASSVKDTQLASRASGEHLGGFMHDLGHELADIGESWGMTSGEGKKAVSKDAAEKHAPGLVMALDNIAHSLRVAFKDQAESRINDMEAMADPAQKPMFDHLREAVASDRTANTHQARAEMRKNASVALSAMAAPEVAQQLASDPQARQALLSAVQQVLSGKLPTLARRNLEKAVGGKAHLESMIGYMNGADAGKKAKANPAENGMFSGKTQATKESDELGDELGDGEATDFDKRAGAKNVDKGSAPSVYGFHKMPTLVTSGSKVSVFAPGEVTKDAQTGTPISSRPRLFTSDALLSDGKTKALDKKVEDVKRRLKVDTSPERMAQLLEQDGMPKRAASVRAAAEQAKTDSRLSERLKEETSAFFVNRAGEYKVGSRPALDIMKAEGMQPAAMVAAYRDYLRQDVRDDSNRTGGAQMSQEQRSTTLRKAQDAAKYVLDTTRKADDTSQHRLTPAERKALMRDAEAYFAERHVVVGEQLSDRDASRITAPELLTLSKATAKTLDFARKDGGKDSAKVLDESNVLFFKSKDLGGKDGELAIRAGDLVHWVMKQRSQSETSEESAQQDYSRGSKDAEYLKALSEGISVVLNSGHVDGDTMPYKVNAKGEHESFAKGVPPSLRLSSMTYGAREFADSKRREARAASGVNVGPAPDRGAAVAAEQNRESAVPEMTGVTPTAKPKGFPEGMPGFPAQGEVRKTQATLRARLEAAGELVGPPENPQTSGEAGKPDGPITVPGGDKKTERTNVVPSELEKQRETDDFGHAIGKDEFSDQRYRSGVEGFDAAQISAPQSPMQARRTAQSDANEITKALTPAPAGKTVVEAPGALGRPQEGFAMIEARLRNAARPTKSEDKNALLGGPHYLYPVVKVLNGDKLGTYDFTPAEAAKANELRQETAKTLLNADMSPSERVALARELATAQAAEKITALNVKTALSKIAGPALQTTDSKAKLDATLANEKFDSLTTRDQVDQFLQNAKARYAELREADEQAYQNDKELPAEQVKALGLLRQWFSERSKDDLGSLYDGIPNGRNDEEARALLNSAAPEVAAQGPKPSAAPDGVRKLNAQDGPSRIASPEEMDAAKTWVAKVLGPKIAVMFEQLTGHSGEWIDHANTIKISTTSAAGAMQTAYHEGLHAFFSKFVASDPKVLAAMRTLADNQELFDRVHALLHGFPKAQAQLVDGEERLAYIFQFWAAGKLDLPDSRGKTLLQKVGKFFRRVTGMVSDTERAVAILQAFHEGKMSEPSAAGQVLTRLMNEGTMTLQARRKMDKLVQSVNALVTPAEAVLTKSESKTAQRIAKMFFTNPGDESAGGEAEGYLNAKRTTAARFVNTFARSINGLSERDQTEVTTALQRKTPLSDIAYGPQREAVKAIRSQLNEFYKYMADKRGLTVKDAGENYFPVVWNPQALIENKDKFISLINDKYKRDGAALWSLLVGHTTAVDEGKLDVGREDGVLSPFFAGKEERKLDWIEPGDREQFLEKDLVATMSRYYHQGVRAAEYSSRFGEKGEFLASQLLQVRNELDEHALGLEFETAEQRKAWVDRRYKSVTRSVAAMEGSLGKDITPQLRKFNSWLTAYQNVRLLPLSLFASFVDPLSMVARGAKMTEAYDTFLRGMKEVFTHWGDLFRANPKERTADKWMLLAEHIGALDAGMFSNHTAEEYASGYMAPGAKRINDALFRLNGMEAWNRGMRSGAVRSAVKFIERHSKLPEVHSDRWLKELGLTPADVHLDSEGELITEVDRMKAVTGMSNAMSERATEKLHQAINRWVEGAVMTPNAAHRPAWGSDPHYSMFFHLKQFSYTFHQTILKRAVKEMNYGNLQPMGAFAWYIPTMIAADITKGLIQGGGTLPAHMQGMGLGDWVMHGAERAGTLGIGNLGVDAAHDVFSLAGPGPEQVIKAFTDPIGKTVIGALPAHGLYAEALR